MRLIQVYLQGHHITLFTRKELAALCKAAGEGKVGMTFVARKSKRSILCLWGSSFFFCFEKELLETMEEVVNDWTCEGLGKVVQDANTAWFAVVTVSFILIFFVYLGLKTNKNFPQWPSMQLWREKTVRAFKASASMKENHTFHITIGFTDSDIHDVPKDRTTLV